MSDFYYRLTGVRLETAISPLVGSIGMTNAGPRFSEPASFDLGADVWQRRRLHRIRVVAWITVANVAVASGFALAGLVHPETVVPGATVSDSTARVFAMYAAARTFPLALAVLAGAWRRSPVAIVVLGGLAGVIQFADALVGMACGDLVKTFGPLAIAAVQLWATIRLGLACRSPHR